jgi:hypothetical protein
VLIFVGYLAVIGIVADQFGIVQGPLLLALLVPVVLAIVGQLGKPEADDFILQLPLIGPLYERIFRPITYYRIDTSQMFQPSVQAAVIRGSCSRHTAASSSRRRASTRSARNSPDR